MNKIGSTASEEKSFESVYGRIIGRTYIVTDAYLCVYLRTKLHSLCVENWTHKGTLYVIFDTLISRLVCVRNLIEIHRSVHNFKTHKYIFVPTDEQTDGLADKM